MEKFVEQGMLWLSLLNPCSISILEDTQEQHTQVPLIRELEHDTLKLISLLERIVQIYGNALENSMLEYSNRMHLIQIQTIITKFQEKLINNHNHAYNITPALRKLHESLEADCIVWKKYHEENNISDTLYTRFTASIKKFGNYCKIKTKVS